MVVEDISLEDVINWFELQGTEDDLAGLTNDERPLYLTQLCELREAAQRAIDRAISVLSKWANESFEEHVKLENLLATGKE